MLKMIAMIMKQIYVSDDIHKDCYADEVNTGLDYDTDNHGFDYDNQKPKTKN